MEVQRGYSRQIKNSLHLCSTGKSKVNIKLLSEVARTIAEKIYMYVSFRGGLWPWRRVLLDNVLLW